MKTLPWQTNGTTYFTDYWGYGSLSLWCAWGESETEQAHCFCREPNRKVAKKFAVSQFPNAKFYR